MRRTLLPPVLLCALTALAACHKPEASGQASITPIPGASDTRRAPGLWEERVADSSGVAVTRYCLDAAADTKLAFLGRQISDSRCTRRVEAQTADGSWRFSTVCEMGAAGRISTDGLARGDFTRAYSIDAQVTTTGAGAAGLNGRTRVRADLALKGPCPSGMAPGDVVLADGRKVKVADLAQATPG
ncbi:MAG: DUF3617 domain-containing protein [Caulobacterales bacterium]